MQLHKVNKEQRLYVMKCGSGFSCYGFDVLDRKARALTAELQRLSVNTTALDLANMIYEAVTPGTERKGTTKAFNAYNKLLKLAASIHERTGRRFTYELTARLVGLEGKRVEVVTTYGETRRFWVGKSTGGCPCHLEILKSNSHDGGAADHEYKSATIIRDRR